MLSLCAGVFSLAKVPISDHMAGCRQVSPVHSTGGSAVFRHRITCLTAVIDMIHCTCAIRRPCMLADFQHKNRLFGNGLLPEFFMFMFHIFRSMNKRIPTLKRAQIEV